MKRITGILTSIAIVISFIIACWIKYDTRGVTPELVDDLQYGAHISRKTQVLSYRDIWPSKRDGYFVFPNRFGRAVIVEVTHRNSRNALAVKLYEQIGAAILSVRTVPGTGTPTHLDFWSVNNGATTLYGLISKAGMPADMSYAPLADYQFETADGYVYEIAVDPKDGVVRIISIIKPNGSLMPDEERPVFWIKVIIQHLILAAVLTVFLVCLLVIPKQVEKRKAGKVQKLEG